MVSGDVVNTAAVSPDALARSRKNASLILQRLASLGQAAVADSLGVSESTVSRWKDGDIEKTALTLAVLGLRVVREDEATVDPRKLAALVALAEDGFAALRDSIAGDRLP